MREIATRFNKVDFKECSEDRYDCNFIALESKNDEVNDVAMTAEGKE
jgi:hypothetical protein